MRDALRNVGLIVCTGGYGYVAAPTFSRLAAAVDEPQKLWVTVTVLRTFSFDETAHALEKYGLVTEKVPDSTFRQRRFTSVKEQSAAIRDVITRGLDPEGLEADGWYYTDCYLCRSPDEIERMPLEQLLR